MPVGMTHNECDMSKDLIKPIGQFFLESNVVPTVTEGTILKFRPSMVIPPTQIQEQASVKDREILKKLIQ